MDEPVGDRITAEQVATVLDWQDFDAAADLAIRLNDLAIRRLVVEACMKALDDNAIWGLVNLAEDCATQECGYCTDPVKEAMLAALCPATPKEEGEK